MAQSSSTRAQDEAAIRAIATGVAQAWAAGDAKTYTEFFAEDADFTIVTGDYIKGRAAIERSHDHIFKTFYKDTTLDLKVRSIRFLSDTIAVVHLDAGIFKKGATKPMLRTVPLFVMVKSQDHWQIAIFQNTDVHTLQFLE